MLKQLLIVFLITAAASVSFCGAELDYVYDLKLERAELEKQRRKNHKALSDKGITSREAHLKIDNEFHGKARVLESKRQKAVAVLFKKADIKMPELMGTDPKTGRGIFGDIDTANMPPEDLRKLKTVIENHNKTADVKHRYTIDDTGGYVHIKELDLTAFRKLENPDKFVYTRGEGKETALAYRTKNDGDTNNLKVYRIDKDGKRVLIKNTDAVIVDKNIYNLDNMKKVGADFSKTDISKVKFQNVGKGTMRIIENTYGKNLERISDPVKRAKMRKLLQQCRYMKSDSAASAGLHSDSREKAFMDEAKRVIGEAYRECAGKTEKSLVEQRDASWKKIQELKEQLKKSQGKDKVLASELEATKTFYEAESKDLHNYRQKQHAAERGILKNGGSELLAEAKGQKIKKLYLADGSVRFLDLEGGSVKTKSQLQNDLLGEQRRKITSDSVPEASKQKTVIVDTDTPNSRTRRTIGTNATFNTYVNKAGDIVDVYEIYKTAEAYLPKDMDPATRKGLKLLITVASTNELARAAIQGTVGGGQAGFDELVKWYKDNPGREPTRWEMMKIGMRGGNQFTKDLAKGMAYGFTIKPFKDVYDIGHGIGDTIYQRKNAELAAEAAREMDTSVNARYREQLDAISQRLAKLDAITEQIAQDPLSQSPELSQVKKIRIESVLAKKLIRNAGIIASTRNDELSVTKKIIDPDTGKERTIIVSSKTTIEERRAAIANAAAYVNRVENMVRKLVVMRNTCRLVIKLVDSVTGKPITAGSWMTVRSGKYSVAPRGTRTLRASGVPGGKCLLKVKASGYTASREYKVMLDPLKSRTYSYTLKLTPAAEEAPLYAQFTITAVDRTSRTSIRNVSFQVINNQRKVNFTTPTGTMRINLETGSCKVYAYAKGYSSGSLNMRVDTSPGANKVKFVYMTPDPNAKDDSKRRQRERDLAETRRRQKEAEVRRKPQPVKTVKPPPVKTKPQGVRWKIRYYDSKKTRISLKTPILNGKIHGTETAYYRNGQVMYTHPHVNGLMNGTAVSYHSNGVVQKRVPWVNGRMNGKMTYYYPSGKLKGFAHYSNDKLKGESRSFFEDGRPWSITNHK
jgi:MORN repeat protein